jgi:uncharacterized membrane protein YjfL (UPF0719 family)
MNLIKRLKYYLFLGLLIPSSSFAQIKEGVDQAAPKDAAGARTVPSSAIAWLDTFTSLLLYLAGAIAVIVIIFGGVRYVTSTGDASRVKQAKDTILYGIIGLVVSILAFAIVQFVIQNLD